MMDSYLAFKEVLTDEQKQSIFYLFLERDQSTENLIFYKNVEEFKTCSDEERHAESQKIFDTHLGPKSKQQINIDGDLKQAILDNIKSSTITPELFQDVQNFILKLIFTSSYTRFIRSSIFLYILPLFSDSFVLVDNQPLISQICISLKNSLSENTDWSCFKPKRKEMEISFKETAIINTTYAVMKFDLTETIDSDPQTILSWLISPKEDRKEWDRLFLQGSIEQVIAKNTIVMKQTYTNSVSNMAPIVFAILYSWHVFEDGSIMLMIKELNHNKIEVTEAVSYEKQKILTYLIQPSTSNNKQSKITIFLRQKLSANTTNPKEEMITSSKCDQVKKLTKIIFRVSKGKYKGVIPIQTSNLFQFVPSPNATVNLLENPRMSLSGGMILDSKFELKDSLVCSQDKKDPGGGNIDYGNSSDSSKPALQTKTRTKSNIKTSQSERRIAELEKENEGLKIQITELKKLVAHYETK